MWCGIGDGPSHQGGEGKGTTPQKTMTLFKRELVGLRKKKLTYKLLPVKNGKRWGGKMSNARRRGYFHRGELGCGRLALMVFKNTNLESPHRKFGRCHPKKWEFPHANSDCLNEKRVTNPKFAKCKRKKERKNPNGSKFGAFKKF